MRRAGAPSLPADAPVARPVVRESVRLAVAETVRRDAHERLAHPRRPGIADDLAPSAGAAGDEVPSPELVRLLAQLRSTVGRYARERREAGAAVERVVPEVKCLVREAASCEAWVDPGDTLMAQVVRWTIEAYYGQPEQAHGPCYP